MADVTQAPVAKDPALTAPTPPTPGGNGMDHEDSLTKEKAEELLAQKRKANAEAKAAKERAEAAEAKLKTFEDREKTELQLAKEQAAKAKADLDASNAQRAHLDLVNQALRAGAVDAEYVAWRAEKEGVTPDSEWFENLKKASPHLFPQPTKHTAPSMSAGGPGAGAGTGANRIAELESAIAAERDPNQKIFLQHALTKEKAKTKGA